MPKPTRTPWPPATGADTKHQKCGACDRCRTDTGRDSNPAASDCWTDYLDAAAQPTRRSA